MIPVATKPLSAYSKSADARLAKTQNRTRAGNKVEHIVRQRRELLDDQPALQSHHASACCLERHGTARHAVSRQETRGLDKRRCHAPRTSPTQALGNTTRKLNYTVRNGDSLYLIARRFRVGIDQIARWNNIDKNKLLRPGQKLTMYVDVTANPARAATAPWQRENVYRNSGPWEPFQ